MLSKRLHDQFLEKYGTCRCADVRAKLGLKFYNMYDPDEVAESKKSGGREI